MGATVLTGGVYPGLPGAYHCPTCGSTVPRIPRAGRSQDAVLGWIIVGAVVVLVAVIAGIVGIVHALQGPRTVPDVRNLGLAAAKSRLKSAGVGYSYNSKQGVFGIGGRVELDGLRRNAAAGHENQTQGLPRRSPLLVLTGLG